jgi:hypothetical protein
MIEFDIATLAELRAEDALQDYYDNIAEELKREEELKMVEEDGPVYYGCLESLSHEELVYKYQQLTAEFERFVNVRN